MKRNKWIGPMFVALFLAGLSLLLYPSFSDYWNSVGQTAAISSYAQEVQAMEQAQKESILREARAYNALLHGRSNPYALPEELKARYEQTLNTGDKGVMAYVDIPAIDVLLPIYHGTSEIILARAVGHLEWSYLPVGGAGTHAVVSGHRGLPSAKLFTDIDKLAEGDLFMLQILDETLTYEIDRILVVEPDDATALVAEAEKDLCTLVTCTPYGVNTHRLLVRGHRVENRKAATTVRIVSEAMQIEPLIVAPVAVALLALLLIVLYLLSGLLFDGKRKTTPSGGKKI